MVILKIVQIMPVKISWTFKGILGSKRFCVGVLEWNLRGFMHQSTRNLISNLEMLSKLKSAHASWRNLIFKIFAWAKQKIFAVKIFGGVWSWDLPDSSHDGVLTGQLPKCVRFLSINRLLSYIRIWKNFRLWNLRTFCRQPRRYDHRPMADISHFIANVENSVA